MMSTSNAAARRRVLLVDDEPLESSFLKAVLERDGSDVAIEADGQSALKRLGESSFSLVVTDLKMPGLDGLALLKAVRAERLPLGVVVLTGKGDAQTALEAMRSGADEFVVKPVQPETFPLLVRRVLERRELIDELESLRRLRRAEQRVFEGMISKSPPMSEVFRQLQRVGPSNKTVLIQGETGTGKELAAKALHALSGRSGPFVAINCAQFHAGLLESELFGHERGSFTDAHRQRAGRFEQAEGGTLFLDEIGETAAALQGKLLRVLDDGSFERVGGSRTIRADVRVIAATNKTLKDEVAAGRFRADLYYRLGSVVELPPLRRRPEDVPLLAMHFLQRASARWAHRKTAVTAFAPETLRALERFAWPGNVRQLENAIYLAVMMNDGPILRPESLPAEIVPRDQVENGAEPARTGNGLTLDVNRPLPDLTDELIAEVERQYFTHWLAHFQGNVARCASQSGLSRRSVSQKLQRLGLDRLEFKPATSNSNGARV